jgi:hypothetical protein
MLVVLGETGGYQTADTEKSFQGGIHFEPPKMAKRNDFGNRINRRTRGRINLIVSTPFYAFRAARVSVNYYLRVDRRALLK